MLYHETDGWCQSIIKEHLFSPVTLAKLVPVEGRMPQVTINNSLKTIADWNTQGVAMCLDGDNFQGSVTAFSHALALLKSRLEDPSTTATAPLLSAWRSWHIDAVEAIRPVVESSTSTNSWVLSNHFFIITPHLILSQDPTMVDVMSNSEADALSAVLVYNLALAIHLSGLMNSQHRSKKYRKAQLFYQHAAGFCHSIDFNAEPDLAVLCLSMANNTAAVSLETLDYNVFEQAREWMGHLLPASPGIVSFARKLAGNFATTGSVRDMPSPAA